MLALESLQSELREGTHRLLAGAVRAVSFLRKTVSQDAMFQSITQAADGELACTVASGGQWGLPQYLPYHQKGNPTCPCCVSTKRQSQKKGVLLYVQALRQLDPFSQLQPQPMLLLGSRPMHSWPCMPTLLCVRWSALLSCAASAPRSLAMAMCAASRASASCGQPAATFCTCESCLEDLSVHVSMPS